MYGGRSELSRWWSPGVDAVRLHASRETGENGCTGLLPTAIAGLVISVAMFLRLPHEAAYLLPAVAFVIVIAERVVERFAFRVLCLALRSPRLSRCRMAKARSFVITSGG